VWFIFLHTGGRWYNTGKKRRRERHKYESQEKQTATQ
jgi:hypothetical protein